MAIGGVGGIAGYWAIGTVIGARNISIITSGFSTLAYWCYINRGRIPLPYRSSTYTILYPSNLFWFIGGSSYSGLSDIFNQYKYNAFDALASYAVKCFFSAFSRESAFFRCCFVAFFTSGSPIGVRCDLRGYSRFVFSL